MKIQSPVSSVTMLVDIGLVCLVPFFMSSGCSSDGGPSTLDVDSGVPVGGIDARAPGFPDASTAEDGPPVACTVTVSGGFAATHPCGGTNFQHFIQTNTSNVNIGFGGGGVIISASIIFPGDLQVGTYTATDTGMTGGIAVSHSQPPPLVSWMAEAAEGGHGVLGSFTLVITTATLLVRVGDNINYELHGTWTATLPPLKPEDPMNPPPDVSFFGQF